MSIIFYAYKLGIPTIFKISGLHYLMFEWNFVCLFIWGFTSLSRMFHSYGDITINDEGASNYDLYSAHMASEGSLAWHTYCDTGHPFIMVISEDPWHSHLLRAFGSGGLSRLGFEHPNFRMRGKRSIRVRNRRGLNRTRQLADTSWKPGTGVSLTYECKNQWKVYQHTRNHWSFLNCFYILIT